MEGITSLSAHTDTVKTGAEMGLLIEAKPKLCVPKWDSSSQPVSRSFCPPLIIILITNQEIWEGQDETLLLRFFLKLALLCVDLFSGAGA